MRKFLLFISPCWAAGDLAGYRAFSLDMVAWLLLCLSFAGALLGFKKFMSWVNGVDETTPYEPVEFDGFSPVVSIATDLTYGAGIDQLNPNTEG
jgi:hypothetical protein